MRSLGYPVVLDVTHSLQLPGGKGDSTGGNREIHSTACKGGVLHSEWMPCLWKSMIIPIRHLVTVANSFRLDELVGLLRQIKEIDRIVK